MSKRRRLIVILTCLAVTIGLIAPFLGPTEPHYRDVSLSEWLALDKAYRFRGFLVLGDSSTFQEISDVETLGAEAPEAIRHIGTNAIPWLIKWMKVPRNSWKTKLNKSIAKLPPAVRPSKLPEWLAATKDRERASLAYRGFVALGPVANSAIPELVKIAGDPRALGGASAVDVLDGLQPPPIAELVLILTRNPSPTIKVRIMARLGDTGAGLSPSVLALFRAQRNPDLEAVAWSEAVPALVSCVKNADEMVAAWSVATLARIRRRPEVAIPALIAALEDSRNSVRLAAAKALGDFGSDAWPATEKLQTLLAKPDISLSREAERALLKIAPEKSTQQPFTDGSLFLDGFAVDR